MKSSLNNDIMKGNGTYIKAFNMYINDFSMFETTVGMAYI